MCVSPYGWSLLAIGSLWAVWLIVLCRERGWFCGGSNGVRTVSPLTKAVMAALCAYCTVSAQKPGNANSGAGGGTDAPQTTAEQQNGDAVQPAAPSENQAAPLDVPTEPSRVVFQSTPASDPRTAAAFDGEPGWSVPAAVAVTPKLDALSFGGGGTNTPSPVRFEGTDAVAVQTLMLAARGDPADLATLVDASGTARLRLASTEGQEAEMSGAERSLTEQFRPGQWQCVRIDLETPTNLAGLFFGGSAGRPEWSRNWRGEIAEVVGFSAPPDADVSAGVANYLAIRWGFGGYPATQEQRQAAIGAGLRYGVVWGSVVILR